MHHEIIAHRKALRLNLPVSGEMPVRDQNGNTIHRDRMWLIQTLQLLVSVSEQFRSREVTEEQAMGVMDYWLFGEKHISELSSGFEEFYVIKHRLIDARTSAEDFNRLVQECHSRIATLQATQRR